MLALALVLAAAAPVTTTQPPRVETVRFSSDTVTIVGTLSVPAATHPPRAAVVLLHGSERGRRDSPFFAVLRESLCAAGLAVLSYDRRGVGESGGVYVETPDLRIPARDAIAAIRFLEGRSEIDRRRVGLLGISQGGWVAPLAATMDSGVAFVIAVSGPGVSPFEQSAYHRGAELVEQGLTAAEADSATELRRLLYRYWHGDRPRAAADSAWTDARIRPWFVRAAVSDELFSRIGNLPDVPPPSRMPADFIRAVNEVFFYDPIPTAEKLRVPVLDLFGAADRRVPVAESVTALRSAYARAGIDATIRIVPEAGHSMQHVLGSECLRCPGPRPPYAPAPGWVDTVVTWLGARRLR